MYEYLFRRLREIHVTITPPVESRASFVTPRSSPEKFMWEIVRRYSDVVGSQEWTFRAGSKENLNKARDLLQKAYDEAQVRRRVGLLTFPNRDNFGRIIGNGGETCEKIQQKTRTNIRVPNKGSPPHQTTVEITGARHFCSCPSNVER
jgi:hypothetical protein